MKPTRKEALVLCLGAISAAWALPRPRRRSVQALVGLEAPDDVVYGAALTRSRSRVAAALRGRVELWETPRLGHSVRTLWRGAVDQLLFTPDDATLVVAGDEVLAAIRVADGAVRMARALPHPIQLLGVSADGAVVHCREDADGPPLLTQRRLDDGSTRAGVYLAESSWRIRGVHKQSDRNRALCLVEDRAGKYLASANLATGEVSDFEPLDNAFQFAVASALDSPGSVLSLTPDGVGVGELWAGDFRLMGESRPWRRIGACGPGPLYMSAFNTDGSAAVVWGRGAAVYVA